MPSRVIKESILSSPNLNRLSMAAECHFYRLLVTADDHGCFEATPLLVKGTVYPLRPKVSVEDVKKWHAELVEQGLCKFWENGDERMYGLYTSFSSHQRIRSTHRRKTPEPPEDLAGKPDGLDPKKKAGKVPDDKPKYSADFETFWAKFPRKDGKKKASEVWERLKKNVALPDIERLMNSLGKQCSSKQWAKDDGQFVPLPTTWLNGQKWDDEGYVPPAKEVQLCPYCKVRNADYNHTEHGRMCVQCYQEGAYDK